MCNSAILRFGKLGGKQIRWEVDQKFQDEHVGFELPRRYQSIDVSKAAGNKSLSSGEM